MVVLWFVKFATRNKLTKTPSRHKAARVLYKGAQIAMASLQPNQTLYVNNLNDRITKQDLKLALYAFFSTHGTVLDIVCLKTPKMRGQAHIVFRDILSATDALKAGQGVEMLGKPMRVAYARGVSDYIKKLEGTYVMPLPDRAMDDSDDEGGETDAPRGTKRSRDAEEEEE
ncbi:hypothetical protein BCR37DRAFT_380157 [Protomyces lactucae-debilis]|uniref:RRM domain-containing protein n=1 Tax=Protomyces lactucae-debilis TaxID=2754530 RepID=A0A1Y2FBQ2_PROLT|nr:uncharacterized protein BCR37DRAFT_380157 [Protomyces lactucae-debilis]ORY81352.1 hypothetical protein BCR37DRAFT_380157 [Protomyces lactucae-debilis]